MGFNQGKNLQVIDSFKIERRQNMDTSIAWLPNVIIVMQWLFCFEKENTHISGTIVSKLHAAVRGRKKMQKNGKTETEHKIIAFLLIVKMCKPAST